MSANLKTLVIAIGGTGTKMVKLLTDRWGGNIPRDVSIAVIDARKAGPEVEVPLRSGGYSGTEQIDYPSEFARIKADPRSGLTSWWPHRVEPQAQVGFHNGCGAIRANGRFFVFRQADRIVQVIDRAIADLTAAGKVGPDGQAQPAQWEVYIVCSLGNGTGGGCFMDVAAIVKDILRRRRFANPLVTGVFIPGSVTRHASDGFDQTAMENRVAASGLAALVELQYQFNRDSAEAFRPPEPYRFVGWAGGTYREFLPAWGIQDATQAAKQGQPYDYAFVLDCVNEHSVLNNYYDILEAGAEALAALIGGADADSRLLDLQLLCMGGRRFGSLGTMALEAPTALLVSYCTARTCLNALAWGSYDRKIDEVKDADLLVDTQPGGGKRLGADEITVEKSVDFFLDHVLDVQEAGADPALTNDLFDRFAQDDAELLREFEQAQGAGSLGTADRSQVVERAANLLNHLMKVAERLPATRTAVLRELWERLPPKACRTYEQLERPNEAGSRWLLEQRVARFVERGAFGPLVVWLTELRRQVKVSRDSVYTTEVENHIGHPDLLKRGQRVAEAAEVKRELEAKASSIFAFFQKAAIGTKASLLQALVTEDFQFLLWQSKILAVFDYYTWLDEHIARLLAGATRAARLLEHDALRQRFDAEVEHVEHSLGMRSAGTKVVYVGCDAQIREGLMVALEADSGTCSREMLRHLPKLAWMVFGQCLGTERTQVARLAHALGEDDLKAVGRTEESTLRDTLGSALAASVEERIRSAVASRANVDEMLVREAYSKIQAWWELYYRPSQQNHPLDQRARDARDALEEVVHDIAEIRQSFEKYTVFDEAMLRTVNGRMEGAVMTFIRARVRNLVGAAQPLWNPDVPADQRTLIQRKAFFNYNKHAAHIAAALAERDTSQPITNQAREFFPASRVECVSVAMGGWLDILLRESEVESYRLAIQGLPGASPERTFAAWFASYNPHITLEAEAAGKRWLAMRDQRVRLGSELGDKEGALVLALAEFTTATHPALFGYIERRGAHYYMRRVIEQRTLEDGRPAYASFTISLDTNAKVGPKGIVPFTEWLEGLESAGCRADDGRAFCKDLKEVLWLDLERLVRGYSLGDDHVLGLGVEGVRTKLRERARQLVSEAGSGPEAAARKAQGEALQILADKLNEAGDRPGFLR